MPTHADLSGWMLPPDDFVLDEFWTDYGEPAQLLGCGAANTPPCISVACAAMKLSYPVFMTTV